MSDPQAIAKQLDEAGTVFLPYTRWTPRTDTLTAARRALGLTAAGSDAWQLKRGQDGVTIKRARTAPGDTISLPGRLVHRDPRKRDVFHAPDGCGMVEDHPDAYIEAIDIPATDLRPCARCFG